MKLIDFQKIDKDTLIMSLFLTIKEQDHINFKIFKNEIKKYGLSIKQNDYFNFNINFKNNKTDNDYKLIIDDAIQLALSFNYDVIMIIDYDNYDLYMNEDQIKELLEKNGSIWLTN